MKSFINFLPPWVETNIQPAFYDKESGSCLQQTARMYAKVNQLVRIANEQWETIQDYINKFIELKDFVEDYFDNLDVQNEINAKLDKMMADGSWEAHRVGDDGNIEYDAGKDGRYKAFVNHIRSVQEKGTVGDHEPKDEAYIKAKALYTLKI